MSYPRAFAFWPLALLAAALLLPKLLGIFGYDFYVGFASRIMIMALLASSLNLLVGVGGMVSLGHAAFFGAGAYTVAILAREWGGTPAASALLSWPLAMLVSALLAACIGAVCLRTRGVYFIMSTLAFAQMLFYVFLSLKSYGGDDGMSMTKRSTLPGLDLGSDVVFYYVVLALLGIALLLLGRLGASRFGIVLRGIKDNELRMESLGYAVFRFKLVAFVVAGAMAGLAGALMSNLNNFVSPNMMHWEQSGVVLVMVILGGLGQLWGGLAGAAVFLLLEEILPAFLPHWQILLGIILLAVVFFAPRGLTGLFRRPA